MIELLRTNDLVLISRVEAILADSGIAVFLADRHMSALEGSLSFLPRRMLVDEDDAVRARTILHGRGSWSRNCAMAEAPDENPSQLVIDAFLGGRLQLRQPAEGHRSGTDAVLLAAAAPADFSGLAIDVGAGVGAAGLAMVIARPRMRLVPFRE